MGNDLTDWAMRQRGLKPAAKILLWYLDGHCDPETRLCHRSLDDLADDYEVGASTIQRHARTLEAKVLIRRKLNNHGGLGRWIPISYILNADLTADYGGEHP